MRRISPAPNSSETGFSLLEVIIALLLLSFLATAVTQTVVMASRTEQLVIQQSAVPDTLWSYVGSRVLSADGRLPDDRQERSLIRLDEEETDDWRRLRLENETGDTIGIWYYPRLRPANQ